MLLDGESIRVERATGVQFVDGKPVTTGSSSFYISASVQPISGKELAIMPEGDRMKTIVWVYTTWQIFPNDIFSYQGSKYQAQTSEAWAGHFKSKAFKIDVGEHAPN